MASKRSYATSEGFDAGTKVKKPKTISLEGILTVLRIGTNEDFEELLTEGLLVNINKKYNKDTLLMIQCNNSCLNGVKILINHGADANIGDPFTIACSKYNQFCEEDCGEIIELLVAHGAHVNPSCTFPSIVRFHSAGMPSSLK